MQFQDQNSGICLAKLRKHNITIIVSTPYMDEAMRCDRVALIQNGKILAIDTPQKDKGWIQQKTLFSQSLLKNTNL